MLQDTPGDILVACLPQFGLEELDFWTLVIQCFLD
jgi:hypothetical protein